MSAVFPKPTLDYSAFERRARAAADSDSSRVARAGLTLVGGALRIRRGGDGLYAEVEKPVTKPSQAVAAWIESMAGEVEPGQPYHRAAELREALAAAAKEVDDAAQAAGAGSSPDLVHLRSALYADALGSVVDGGSNTIESAFPAAVRGFWPWLLVSALGGVIVGMLVGRKK